MIVFIFLCAFFSQAYAANYSEEAKKESTFNFACSKYGPDGYKPIESFMQSKGFSNEYQYFFDIAENEKLDDSQKLEKDRVFTKSKYFQELAKKDQDKKDDVLGALLWQELAKKDQDKKYDVLEELLWVENDSSYCYRRLLLAACMYVKANADCQGICGSSTTLITEALVHNDVPLVKIALEHGADPNKRLSNEEVGLGIWSVLSYCSSREAAQLVIEQGADVNEAYELGDDLVNSQCVLEENEDLLKLYLEYIKPDESNEYGKKWMQTLSSGRSANDNTVSFLRVLLERGCKYTAEIKDGICKRHGKQEELKMEFKRHEDPDIKPAKR